VRGDTVYPMKAPRVHSAGEELKPYAVPAGVVGRLES